MRTSNQTKIHPGTALHRTQTPPRPHPGPRPGLGLGRWVIAALAVGALATTTTLAAGGRTPPAGAAIPPGAPSAASAAPGYWEAGSNGAVLSFGDAAFEGAVGSPASPVVGMAADPGYTGYWLAEANGNVVARGGAQLYPRTGGDQLRTPVVGIAATPDGGGYWLVSAHGGVTSYGDAGSFGSAGQFKLRAPVVGMAVYPGGAGYWVLDSHGDVFDFGAAPFVGSTAFNALAAPISAMAPTPSGQGYWLVTRNGEIYSFGDATFHGSTHAQGLRANVSAITTTPSGRGYWVLTANGGVSCFGDASFYGSALTRHHLIPGVALVMTEAHPGAQTSIFYYPWYGTPATVGYWRHWNEGGHHPPLDIGSDYYPLLGAYSSTDPAVVGTQMGEIARAGINEVISSWWGQGSYEDQALRVVAPQARANGLELAVEIEPYADRTPTGVAGDISYLRSTYGITDFYIYQAAEDPAAAWAAALGPVRPGIRLFAAGDPSDMITGSFDTFAAAATFDGIYTYDPYELTGSDFAGICGAARMNGLACSPSVSPGFEAMRAEHTTNIKARSGGATYANSWSGALAANPDQVSITSFNEWHEGSQIEPDQALCIPGYCYKTYSGSPYAYLDRTYYWTKRYVSEYRG
jgi:glycoprotein endo-alpha-1,2-mannosidase